MYRVGALPGLTSRLDHIATLGADALWLSPGADGGSDAAGLDALIAGAHALGLRVLLDLVRGPAPAALGEIVRTWLRRGVDGFGVDVADADVVGLAALRDAAGPDAFLVGEVHLERPERAPYLRSLDAAVAFELVVAPWRADALREVLGGAGRGDAWTLSSPAAPRLVRRLGRENERLAALLLLTLPGPVFIYEGDELGLEDGPGATELRTAADEARDPRSTLSLYRRLVALRRELRGELELLPSGRDVLAFRRGRHAIVLNLGDGAAPLPLRGDVLLAVGGAPSGGVLAPRSGVCLPAPRGNDPVSASPSLWEGA